MLPQFTKEKWKALSGKEKWDVLVAMRGPDLKNGQILKWTTTAVLRHVMWPVLKATGGSALVNNKWDFVLVPQFNHVEWGGDFDAGHFLGHIRDTAGILGVPIIAIPASIWSKAIKGGSMQSLHSVLANDLTTYVKDAYNGNWPDSWKPLAAWTAQGPSYY